MYKVEIDTLKASVIFHQSDPLGSQSEDAAGFLRPVFNLETAETMTHKYNDLML